MHYAQAKFRELPQGTDTIVWLALQVSGIDRSITLEGMWCRQQGGGLTVFRGPPSCHHMSHKGWAEGAAVLTQPRHGLRKNKWYLFAGSACPQNPISKSCKDEPVAYFKPGRRKQKTNELVGGWECVYGFT